MKVKDFDQIIQEWTPLQYAEDFDNVGLLIGDKESEVTGVLVSHDCLEETIDEAIHENCNLIICFHPIIFKGLKRFNGNSYVERVVIKAIKNDIAVYAVHTALDNSFDGVSAEMCHRLGLFNRQILLPQRGNLKKLTTYIPRDHVEAVRKAIFDAGGGHIGNYSHCSFNIEGKGSYKGNENADPAIGQKEKLEWVEETYVSVVFESHRQARVINALLNHHPYEEVAYDVYALENEHPLIGMGMIAELERPMSPSEFLLLVKSTFHLKVIRHSKLVGDRIEKVAVLGGSGAFAIEKAIAAGADAYITADLKYHDFYRANDQLILMDIGHYESERFTKNLIVDYLTKKITNFAPALPEARIILSKKNTNPINYF